MVDKLLDVFNALLRVAMNIFVDSEKKQMDIRVNRYKFKISKDLHPYSCSLASVVG